MSEKSDTLKPEQRPQFTADQIARQKKAREALLRLREIGENLPPVDAVAVVREGRDLAGLMFADGCR